MNIKSDDGVKSLSDVTLTANRMIDFRPFRTSLLLGGVATELCNFCSHSVEAEKREKKILRSLVFLRILLQNIAFLFLKVNCVSHTELPEAISWIFKIILRTERQS